MKEGGITRAARHLNSLYAIPTQKVEEILRLYGVIDRPSGRMTRRFIELGGVVEIRPDEDKYELKMATDFSNYISFRLSAREMREIQTDIDVVLDGN